jgi:hypothetical protein
MTIPSFCKANAILKVRMVKGRHLIVAVRDLLNELKVSYFQSHVLFSNKELGLNDDRT